MILFWDQAIKNVVGIGGSTPQSLVERWYEATRGETAEWVWESPAIFSYNENLPATTEMIFPIPYD